MPPGCLTNRVSPRTLAPHCVRAVRCQHGFSRIRCTNPCESAKSARFSLGAPVLTNSQVLSANPVLRRRSKLRRRIPGFYRRWPPPVCYPSFTGQPTQYAGTTGRHGRRQCVCLAQIRRQEYAVDRGEVRGDTGKRLAIHQGSLAGYGLNGPRGNGANKKRNPQAGTLHPMKGGESRSTAFLPYLDLRSVSTWKYSRNDYRVKCLTSSMKPSPDAGSTCRSASSGRRRGSWGSMRSKRRGKVDTA